MKIPSGWHRYMEGYDARRVEIGPGRFKTEYEFTGDYRVFALSERQFKRMKVFYVCMAAALTIVYVLAATMTTSSFRVNYVAIPAFWTVVPLVCLLYGAVGFVITPQQMTPRHYRSSVLMTRYSAFIVMVLMGDSALSHAVCLARAHQALVGRDLAYLLLGLLAALIASVMFIATLRIKIRILYRDRQIIQPLS